MSHMIALFKRHCVRLTAITIILALFYAAHLPTLSAQERSELAAQFRFETMALPEVSGYTSHAIRSVHPSLDHIAAWISSVGGGVALHDLDRDGLPNDVCYVDTRIDQVIVGPVPGTAGRYSPFVLNPAPLAYDVERMAPMGCLPGDANEDGLADILVYYWGRTPVIFLRRSDSSGALSGAAYVPQEITDSGERWFTNAAIYADLDGDGHNDLIIGNYFPDGARILDETDTGSEHMQHSMSRANNGGTNHFMLWKGATATPAPSVQFQTVPDGLDESMRYQWTLALAACDLDGDMLPEVYVANDFGPDRLLHNRSTPGNLQLVPVVGRKTLTTPNSKIVGHDSFKGMGVDCGNLNDDDVPDMYVSNIADEYALEESHLAFVSTGDVSLLRQGIAPYTDRSEELGLSRSGWGWDVKFGDFNNDGVTEIVQATSFIKGAIDRWALLHEVGMGNDQLLEVPNSWPRFREGDDLSGHEANPFFVRAPDGRFYDLAAEVGLGAPYVTRGVATADVDGDGRLDVALGNQWEQSVFIRNTLPQTGTFLGLRLLLPTSGAASDPAVTPGNAPTAAASRPATGATATIHLPDGRRVSAQVDGGNGHSGKRSPDLFFGLGAIPENTLLPVDVRWRDAQGRIHTETFQVQPGWHTVLLY